MKYLFILGRNIELSALEVREYLKRIDNPILEEKLIDNGILVEISKDLKENTISQLGGVLRIGKVQGEIEELKNIMIYTGEKNNLNYTLWEFSSKSSEVLEYLKKRFKEEKLKAVYKGMNSKVDSQDGEEFFIPGSKLIDEEYFVFENLFGFVMQKCDYENIETRDMRKPIRRSSLAISPRLGKIMINLSGIKEGKVLDAFCGVGTILQEALLQGFEVVGVDTDAKAIKGAEENLKWFGFEREKYSLINFDSTRVTIPECSVMVSEPDLGTTLKKTPPRPVAEKTLKDFERLIIRTINNVKGKVSGRFVFSSPLIRIGKKRIGCNIEDICARTNYKLALDAIDEYREAQFVGRRIFVLEKA